MTEPVGDEASAVDVLVCGAGASGLTLAIELARRGISFRLIEKAQQPFHGSRGKGIQPRTQEVFEDLGILDRVFAAGGTYPLMREHRGDGSWTDSRFTDPPDVTPAEPYPHPLLVPQFLTEAVMRERLMELGRQPEFGRELAGLQQDDSGVTAQVSGPSGPQIIRARYLIGADGGRSFVRHALGIDFPGKTLGVRAVAADVSLTGLSRDAWHRFQEGSMTGQIALCPLPGTDLFQIQAPVPLEGEVDLSAQGLGAMVAGRTGRSDIRVESVSWASAYTMSARLADRYQVGRVLLVGDAAHVHPPTGGQGLKTSVQESYKLGWKLAAVLAGAPEALLSTYEEERRPVAAAMLGLSTRLLDEARRGENRRGRDVRQLDLGYPESSLAREAPVRSGGLRSGDRAPDAPLTGAAGQPRRLFDLLKGTHWTLLGREADRRAVAPRPRLHIHGIGPGGDLRDPAGCFHEAYELAPGGWVLIRPDGYVGAIVEADGIAVLESLLQACGQGVPQ